ncbi:MAG: hypothetical protein HKN25_01590 [Pyrinomonadaceae bacterium]|nr:hypothetical protein [Pyrinomonadaceae bacterium]
MEPLGGHQLDAQSGKRSRKWIIAIIIFAVFVPIVMTVGIFALVFGGLYFGSKSTEEFKCAMAEINKNKEATELLGKPIEDGYLVMPNIQVSGPMRRVNFSVPVSGPKGSATLQVISYRDGFNSNFQMSLRGEGEMNRLLHRGKFPCKEGE